MNSIIDFRSAPIVVAAEREKTMGVIKYQTALSILTRLHKDKYITSAQYKESKNRLAKYFQQDDCAGI